MESLRRVRTVFTVLCFIGAVYFLYVSATVPQVREWHWFFAAICLMAAFSAHARTIISGLTTGWFFVAGPLVYVGYTESIPTRLGAIILALAVTIGGYVLVRVTWWIIAPLVARLRYKLRA